MRNKLISQYLSATGNRDVPGDDHESILAGSLRRRAPIDEIPSHKLDSATGSSLCDERLGHIVISTWTKVPVTNEFAARAISLYLETDHPLLGLFDADLFLDDLVSGQINFCSPLLVNALLCWACVSFSFLFFFFPFPPPFFFHFSNPTSWLPRSQGLPHYSRIGPLTSQSSCLDTGLVTVGRWTEPRTLMAQGGGGILI